MDHAVSGTGYAPLRQLLTVRVNTLPIGKARYAYGQSGRGGAGRHTYIPNRTNAYEHLLAQEAKLVMRATPPYTGPLRTVYHCYFPVPPSWSATKRAQALAGLLGHTQKPDRDNCDKAICDALNGVVWNDDCQIVDGRTIKHWAEKPLVVIEVFEAIPARLQLIDHLATRIRNVVD